MTARWRKRFIDRLSSVCIPASQEPIMIRDISLLGDLSGPLCHQQQCHRWQCHPLKNWTNKEREKNSGVAGESSQAINSSAMSAWLIATLARKTIAIIVAFSLSNLIRRQEEQQTWCSIEPAWIIPSTYFYTISGVEWKPRRLQFNTHPRFLPFHLTNEYIVDYIVYLRNEQWISLPLSHQPVYSDMKGNLRAPIGLVDSWQLEANRECCVCSFVISKKRRVKRLKTNERKERKNCIWWPAAGAVLHFAVGAARATVLFHLIKIVSSPPLYIYLMFFFLYVSVSLFKFFTCWYRTTLSVVVVWNCGQKKKPS